MITPIEDEMVVEEDVVAEVELEENWFEELEEDVKEVENEIHELQLKLAINDST